MDNDVKESQPHLENGKDQISPLERLPPELRNHTYTLTITKGYDLRIEDAMCQPALAAINSNIRGEVLPIFFGGNTFLANRADLSGNVNTFEERLNSFDKYMPLMRCIGVYEVNAPTRLGLEKLYVRIRDDLSVRVWLRGVHTKAPTCLCSIQRIAHEERGKEHVKILPRRLFLAAATDIDQTVELIHGPEWAFSGSTGIKAAGCEKCREFRTSVECL